MTISSAVLRLFFTINYVLTLCIVAFSVDFQGIYHDNKMTFAFLCLTYCMYGVLYLMPAYLITRVANSMLKHRLSALKLVKVIYITAVITTAITTLLMYADAKLYALYGMHINGFVLNLILTPGGIASLGGSTASDLSFVALALSFLLIQCALLWVAIRLSNTALIDPINRLSAKMSGWQYTIAALLSVLTLHMIFAYDNFTSNGLAVVAESIPFYQTVSSRSFFRALGVSGRQSTVLKVNGKLNYPLHPLQFEAQEKPYNVIWLVAESWRADTLTEHIMPNTWHFAENAMRFTQNYSGGNGTRAGVFSLLMGMPASYWFTFLQERRGAAIIDVMQRQDYQMRFFTSALFTYPEFDKTIFSQVPTKLMQSNPSPKEPGWKNDEINISDMLTFIDHRDKSKPFFTFMFFESPHARYGFPAESVIAQPYIEDLNYATLSREALRTDIVPIKNRYINSVHHLDNQFGHVFDYLSAHQLLDNTIVVLVGDHGEEFMEHGFWGHNSTFVNEQVRTPLVIYAPHQAPRVSNQLTSHMDVVASLMPLLGVTNPKADYTLGINLLAGETRDHTYIADWDRLAYVDADAKIVYPVTSKALFTQAVTTMDDRPLVRAAVKRIIESKQLQMQQTMSDLKHFMKN